MNIEKILDKIVKKVEQIEKMHDKESILCEEVKDLIEEVRDNNLEDDADSYDAKDNEDADENLDDEDFEDEDEEEEDIDEDEDK